MYERECVIRYEELPSARGRRWRMRGTKKNKEKEQLEEKKKKTRERERERKKNPTKRAVHTVKSIYLRYGTAYTDETRRPV